MSSKNSSSVRVSSNSASKSSSKKNARKSKQEIESLKIENDETHNEIIEQLYVEPIVETIKITTHANNVKFSDKRPGVIACIVEMLKNANESKPILKHDILNELVKRFPERGIDKLLSTLTMQCPSGLRIEKRIVVKCVKDDANVRRYYIDNDETAKLQQAYSATRVKSSEVQSDDK